MHHFDQQNLLWRMLWTCQNCVHKVQIVCTKWWEQEVGCFDTLHCVLMFSLIFPIIHISCSRPIPLHYGLGPVEKWNVSLRPHFYQSKLFQKKYLKIVLCPVSLLIYSWGLVEHSQLQKKNLRYNKFQFKQAAGRIWIKFWGPVECSS